MGMYSTFQVKMIACHGVWTETFSEGTFVARAKIQRFVAAIEKECEDHYGADVFRVRNVSLWPMLSNVCEGKFYDFVDFLTELSGREIYLDVEFRVVQFLEDSDLLTYRIVNGKVREHTETEVFGRFSEDTEVNPDWYSKS